MPVGKVLEATWPIPTGHTQSFIYMRHRNTPSPRRTGDERETWQIKSLKQALSRSVAVPRPVSWLRDGQGSYKGTIEETEPSAQGLPVSSHTLDAQDDRRAAPPSPGDTTQGWGVGCTWRPRPDLLIGEGER